MLLAVLIYLIIGTIIYIIARHTLKKTHVEVYDRMSKMVLITFIIMVIGWPMFLVLGSAEEE